MAATQHRPQAEDDDELERDIGREEEDEGPHDVPDETVIEKTLPSRPGGPRGGPAGGEQ